MACCPGGSAAGVVAYLAKADVPLSVIMSTGGLPAGGQLQSGGLDHHQAALCNYSLFKIRSTKHLGLLLATPLLLCSDDAWRCSDHPRADAAPAGGAHPSGQFARSFHPAGRLSVVARHAFAEGQRLGWEDQQQPSAAVPPY